MDDAKSGLKRMVGLALDWLEAKSTRISPSLADLAMSHGIKTVDYFMRVLYTWVNDLFNGDVSMDEFINQMADLIQQQLTRAWNEGMRANGLDPIEEMTPEFDAMLQELIASEYAYVDGFAADIASSKFTLSQLQAHADLWANRYNDVVNQAKLATADAADKYIWRMGATEKHCSSCSTLDGVVATANEWDISGIKPQGENLECGGWNCKCSLEPTTQRRSPKALDVLLTIGINI